MPQKLIPRLVDQLKVRGLSEGAAQATARKKMREAGNLKPGSDELTPKGKRRQEMGAAGRAKDRAAQASGHKAGDFKYSTRTNRATLKGTTTR